MEILIFILFNFFIDAFVCLYVGNLDVIDKDNNKELIRLGKFRFLFLRSNKHKEIKEFIGKKSFILQVVHISLMLVVLAILILNVLIFKNVILRYIVFSILIIYTIVYVVLAINIIEKIDKKAIIKERLNSNDDK